MDTSQDLGFDYTPELPIAISCVAGRYLIFDIKIATWLRRQHNICGITIGSLPIAPSQNIFLGIPVEIMPEEAQLLVERGIGFVSDDARAHDQAMQPSNNTRRADYLARLHQQTKHIESLKLQQKAESRKRGLGKRSKKAATTPTTQATANVLDFDGSEDPALQKTEADFSANENQEDLSTNTTLTPNTSSNYGITPATSEQLLPTSPQPSITPNIPTPQIPDLPKSYPLYRHLHDKGFFMTPGLRFGCQYAVYPGDTLRFHSHFLAVGRQWDEEIDLMEIVGGGRLGTGVKKGFLFGGEDPTAGAGGRRVRTFSVEWAAM